MSPPHHCHSPLHAGNVPHLAGGRADNDCAHDNLPESGFVLPCRKILSEEEEEGCLGRGQPPLSAVGNRIVVRAGGGGHQTHERGTSAEASIFPGGVPACYCCCSPRWCESSSSCAKMAESNRRCRRRPRTLPPEAGNANVSHANRRPFNECTHRRCVDVDAREYHRADSSRGGHGSVAPAAVAAAAGVKVIAAAAAPDGVGIGEDLRGSKNLDGSGGPLSRAAVEAWEAVETWASAVAAATGAVAVGGSLVSAETAESGVGKKAGGAAGLGLGETATIDPGPHRRRNCCAVQAAERVEGGCSSCCRCAFSGGPAGMIDICQSVLHRRDSVLCGSSSSSTSAPGGVCQSAVHRRDSVLCSKSKVQIDAALRFGGRVPGMAATRGSRTSTFPRYAPTRTSAESDERLFDAAGRSKAPSAVSAVPTTVRPVVVGAAAAIVLGRIDRGEKLWGRRAWRAGLAALKDHRTRAGGQKMRGATAARFHKTALKARGLRALEALAKRKKGRGEAAVAAAAAAAAAAATADAFARAQRMRRVVAMLSR